MTQDVKKEFNEQLTRLVDILVPVDGPETASLDIVDKDGVVHSINMAVLVEARELLFGRPENYNQHRSAMGCAFETLFGEDGWVRPDHSLGNYRVSFADLRIIGGHAVGRVYWHQLNAHSEFFGLPIVQYLDAQPTRLEQIRAMWHLLRHAKGDARSSIGLKDYRITLDEINRTLVYVSLAEGTDLERAAKLASAYDTFGNLPALPPLKVRVPRPELSDDAIGVALYDSLPEDKQLLCRSMQSETN